MGTSTDAGLAVLVLAAVGVAFLLAEAAVRWSAAAIGGLGTIAFELAAARAYETVRDYWERPVVQAGSVCLALLGIAVGTTIAPEIVLSVALGALAVYLCFLLLLWFGPISLGDRSS